MVPTITYKQLKNVKFPVFHIPDDDVEYRDGLVLYQNKVLDDKNQLGDTLGKRRLQTPHKLHRLTRAYPDIPSVIFSGRLHFIDSDGNVFYYQKTKFVYIRSKKIKKVEKKEIASLLWAVGVDSPFTIPRPPPDGYTWVSIMYFGDYAWIPCDYTQEHHNPYRKKI